MQLAVTHQVLLALYSETQKEHPNVCSFVTPKKLGINPIQFRVVIDKLENDGFIYGSLIITGDCCPIPRMVIIDNARLTQFGLECVERIQDILGGIPSQALNAHNVLRQPWVNQVNAQIKEACSIDHYKVC